MAAIETMLFVTAAGFEIVVVATVIVAIGVRHEVKYRTFTNPYAPTFFAAMARRLVGGYFERGRPAAHEERQEHAAAGDRR